MKNSIYLIILFIFFSPKKINGQTIQDFGTMTFSEVQSMNDYKPCDIVYNKLLMYCVEDESKIVYLFKSGVLDAIQTHTIYSNYHILEHRLQMNLRFHEMHVLQI
jgi:hypothetical protein